MQHDLTKQTVLYLTMNPNLGASARTLQDWLLLGREAGLQSCVAIRAEGDLSKKLRTYGFKIQLNPMPWPDRIRPWKSAYYAWKLASWARRQKVDIIYCYEHDLWPFVSILRHLLQRPTICHCHSFVSSEFANWAFKGERRHPDVLIWNTQTQARDCERAVANQIKPEKQRIVPLGLDLRRFGTLTVTREEIRRSWGVDKEAVVIGMASALREGKHIGDFIELIRVITDCRANVFGVLAGNVVPGEEEYGKVYASRLREFETSGRFRWLGFQEPIEPFMHGVDVYVSTSCYETFGMSVCEAMACSRPVVAYRGGAVQEVLGESGIVVDDKDLSGLICQVDKLVNDKAQREKLGKLSRNRIADFFDSAVGFNQLMELYTNLLRPRHARGQMQKNDVADNHAG